MTSPGCPAIVGSMSHLSVPDEFVLHSRSLVSQPDLSTAGEQAAVARRRVDHYRPNQTKPPDTLRPFSVKVRSTPKFSQYL